MFTNHCHINSRSKTLTQYNTKLILFRETLCNNIIIKSLHLAGYITEQVFLHHPGCVASGNFIKLSGTTEFSFITPGVNIKETLNNITTLTFKKTEMTRRVFLASQCTLNIKSVVNKYLTRYLFVLSLLGI